MSDYSAMAKALDLPDQATEREVFDAIAKLDKSQMRLIEELTRLQCLAPNQWEWVTDAVRLDPLGFYRLLRTKDSRLARIWASTARGDSVAPWDVGYLLRLISEKEEEIADAREHHEAVLEARGERLAAAEASVEHQTEKLAIAEYFLRRLGHVRSDADPVSSLQAERARDATKKHESLFPEDDAGGPVELRADRDAS